MSGENFASGSFSITYDNVAATPDLTTRVITFLANDVCLHCGLCAERCPTNAWDMAKSVIYTPQLDS